MNILPPNNRHAQCLPTLLLCAPVVFAQQGGGEASDDDSWGAVVGLVVAVVVLGIIIVCLAVALCESRRSRELPPPKEDITKPVEKLSVSVQTDPVSSKPSSTSEEHPEVIVEEAHSVASEESSEPGVAFDINIDDKYQLKSDMVYGENATIVKAIQKATSREVAVKVYDKAEICLKEFKFYATYFTEERSELYTKAKSFIPEFIDAGQITLSDKLYPAVVLEHGKFTLRDFLSPKKKNEQYVVFAEKSIFYQICLCLRFLHAGRYVHGDLNTDTIMFFGSRWKLLDFAYIGQFGVPMICRPKPGFGAPEVVCKLSTGDEHMTASPEIDIWSLGSLAYEIITKQPILPESVYDSDDIESMCFGTKSFPWEDRPYAFWSQIKSPAAVKIIQNCLHRDPGKRWSIEKVIQYIKFWS